MATIAFFTGAGISANAGIPVYRQAGSSWTDADLEKKSHSTRWGNHLDELWNKHWGPLGKQMREAEPTHAHRAIAETGHDNIVITQNVDDLHERAGSNEVYHLHGVMDIACFRCHSKNVKQWNGNGAPQCEDCGKRKTRPAVVLFGERLNQKMYRDLATFCARADAIVVVGSSLNVFPAASLVMDNIAKSIIINKDKTPFWSFARETHQGDADLLIDEVLKSL